MLGSDGNIVVARDAEGIIVLTSGEGSAEVVTDDGSTVAILPRKVGTVLLGDGEGGILEADRKRGALL